MRSQERKISRPWLWPALLIIVGIVLLLDNFLLLGDFNAVALLPLLLVVAGAQILVRGDLIPSSEARTFGITRGSVQAATLEISSGAIDVDVRPLQRPGRLVAGQFAAETRPYLDVQEYDAHLRMLRSQTPWYAFADWQIGLATDLPWQILVSTHLGKATLDLTDLIIEQGVIATGFGEIRLILPREVLGEIVVRSTLGNIHITTPEGCCAEITVQASRLFTVHADTYRYTNPEPNVYRVDGDADAPMMRIQLRGVFGDAYLA
ncbi:MAG: hypothetical protein OHK0046_01390 [Anaerolineae bacterium]